MREARVAWGGVCFLAVYERTPVYYFVPAVEFREEVIRTEDELHKPPKFHIRAVEEPVKSSPIEWV